MKWKSPSKKKTSSVRVVLPPFLGIFPVPVTRAERIYFPILSNWRRHETLMCWTVEGRLVPLERAPLLWGGFPQVLSSASVALRALHKQLRPGEVMDTWTTWRFWKILMVILFFCWSLKILFHFQVPSFFFLNKKGSRVWVWILGTWQGWSENNFRRWTVLVMCWLLFWTIFMVPWTQFRMVLLVWCQAPIQTLTSRSRSNSNRLTWGCLKWYMYSCC